MDAPVDAPAGPPPAPGRGRWAGAAAVAAAGGVVWLLAAVARRAPAPDALGATPAARLAALARAVPPGTPLDSARAVLRARRLDFAQERAAGGGTALVVALPGGGAGPARAVAEFDARRRLVGWRAGAGAPGAVP